MNITIYTDGGCSGNPGPGAWAAILSHKEHKKTIGGGELNTTNNRMELLAAIKALQNLKKEGLTITLYSDSEYLIKGMTGRLSKWKNNNWKTSNKKPVKNKDLWLLLDNLSLNHNITWLWVKGHSTNISNKECDKIVQNILKELKKGINPDNITII